MGCDNTFEFRRQEMALLSGRKAADISCEEVAEHFLQDVVSPSGALRQYLEHGCVVCRIGNTLFVHGAIDRNSMRFVPSPSTRFELPSVKLPPAKIADTVDEWVEEMNNFLRLGLDDFAARPGWDAGRSTRGGESLMALQNREAMFGRTVVSACFSDGGCIATQDAEVRPVGSIGSGADVDDEGGNPLLHAFLSLSFLCLFLYFLGIGLSIPRPPPASSPSSLSDLSGTFRRRSYRRQPTPASFRPESLFPRLLLPSF